MGVNYPGWQLARWEFSWAKNFPGGNCPGWELSSGSYPGWEFFEWELSGWELSWVESFRLGIVRVLVILGGSFLRWEFSGWESSGWRFPCYHYEVPDDNVQRQFVYFIVASCRNDLKSFFRLKKSEILHSYFCQRYTPNTTKSDICC